MKSTLLDSVANKLGLKIRSCGNGHIKIEGGKYEVSFYPESKRKTIYFRHQDMSAKYHGGTWELAFELALNLPNESEAKVWAHRKNKRGGVKWARNVLLRRDPKCYLCALKLTEKTATVDHFIPLALGGRNSFENLRLACEPCNKAKGHKIIRGKFGEMSND